jgi:glucokinase
MHERALGGDRADLDSVVAATTAAADEDESPPLELGSCALAMAVQPGRLAVALVTRLGEVVSAQRVPLSVADDPVFTAATMVQEVLHAAGVDHAKSRALPGIGISVADGVQVDEVAQALRDQYRLPVRKLAESIALTVAEHWRGAARGRRNVLGIALAQTVGGAVLVDGRLVLGTTGNAGHIGHVCVDPFGPACPCGGRGCLSMLAGGAAIEQWARSHGHPDPSANAAAVAEAAQRGEPVALATMRRAGEAVGIAAAGAVTLLDLDVVVINGPVATAGGTPLFDAIDDGYTRYAGLDHARTPRMVHALLGADAPLIGAAAAVLAPDSYPSSP